MATVDLVIPEYNEEHVLAGSVATVLSFLEGHPEHEWRIVVANRAPATASASIAADNAARKNFV